MQKRGDAQMQTVHSVKAGLRARRQPNALTEHTRTHRSQLPAAPSAVQIQPGQKPGIPAQQTQHTGGRASGFPFAQTKPKPTRGARAIRPATSQHRVQGGGEAAMKGGWRTLRHVTKLNQKQNVPIQVDALYCSAALFLVSP